MFAKRVADAVVDSVVALGLRERTTEIRDEIHELIEPALAQYQRFPNWPSGLTANGTPIEISLAISAEGSAALRCTVDCADHCEGLGVNWARYMRFAAIITGVGCERGQHLWRIIATHLDGLPPLVRTPLVHGFGYAPGGVRRATLYFNTRWLPPHRLRQRLARFENTLQRALESYSGPPSSILEGVSYDFAWSTADVIRSKAYFCPSISDSAMRLADALGESPDIETAGALFEEFRPSHLPARSLLLELNVGRSEEQRKVMFSAVAWGWDNAAGLAELLAWLTRAGLSLRSLETVLAVWRESGILLRPSFVSFGGSWQAPNVTFYFYPIVPTHSETRLPRPRAAAVSSSELVEEMLGSSLQYLRSTQEPDGCWIDFDLEEPDGVWVDFPLAGRSDELVTAYVAAILATGGAPHDSLTAAAKWLQQRYRPSLGWGWNRETSVDAEATALALVALQRICGAVPEGADTALLQFRLPGGGYRAYADWDIDLEHGLGAPEITAAVVLAQLWAGLAEPQLVRTALDNLISQQREEGGWNAFWWRHDLVATSRVLEALRALAEDGCRSAGAWPNDLILHRIRSARPAISAQAIADEPFLMGLWLKAWVAAGGDLEYPSVRRILASLYSQQQSDGRWLSYPSRRVGRTKLLRPWARSESGKQYVDTKCVVTTATVAEGLLALRSSLRRAT